MVLSHTDQEIRLRLAFGEMTLPSSLVERVVEKTSPLETYLMRRRQLAEDDGSAEQWFELARWAETAGLDHGYREALLLAARRNPRLEGLAPHMRLLEYVLDPSVVAWVRARPEPQARAAARVRRVRDEPVEDSTTEERLSRAVELLAAADLARESRAATPAPVVHAPLMIYPTLALPIVHWSGWRFPRTPSAQAPPPANPNPEAPIVRRPADPMARALLRRQPGSLIPLSTLAR